MRGDAIVCRGGGFHVTDQMMNGVGIVQVEGRLGAGCVRDLRRAADRVLARGPAAVVVDTRRVTEAGAAPAVLGLLQRYLARRGAPLLLAGPGAAVQRALDEAQVGQLFRVAASPGLATLLGLARQPTSGLRAAPSAATAPGT